MITQKNILLKLQKKYKEGGFALISQASGEIIAFGKDIKKLYKVIDEKKIKDENKIVMHIPPIHVKHVFQISLSIQIG
ncbi:hypothetical protein HY357_02575 [Candidatus Roizmanbacteria bacterium]|nr:hypothetical protein [Candidatus Roizmanbacteria bacterium]